MENSAIRSPTFLSVWPSRICARRLERDESAVTGDEISEIQNKKLKITVFRTFANKVNKFIPILIGVTVGGDGEIFFAKVEAPDEEIIYNSRRTLVICFSLLVSVVMAVGAFLADAGAPGKSNEIVNSARSSSRSNQVLTGFACRCSGFRFGCDGRSSWRCDNFGRSEQRRCRSRNVAGRRPHCGLKLVHSSSN